MDAYRKDLEAQNEDLRRALRRIQKALVEARADAKQWKGRYEEAASIAGDAILQLALPFGGQV